MSVNFGSAALIVSVMAFAPQTAQAAGSIQAASPTPQVAAASGACASGYVWREANAADRVCVTPEVRQQVADDNAAAPGRIARHAPGAFPPVNWPCAQGYVWRMANSTDYTCVTPQVRAQAAEDNAAGPTRLVGALAVRTLNPGQVPKEVLAPPKLPAQAMPSPPRVAGCYSYAKRSGIAHEWRRVECLSPEQLSRVPRPTEGGTSGVLGIQSPSNIVAFEYPKPALKAAAGLGGAAVTIASPTPAGWGVTDSASGVSQYSVQLNTNPFPAVCHASNPPVPPISPIFPVTPCTSGDTAAVQFTYDSSYAGGHTDVVCIWNVDVSKQLYFWPQTWQECAQVSNVPGFWQAGSTINIAGTVDFTNHVLTLVAGIPWASEFVSVVTPDWFALCWTPGVSGPQCSWNGVSGTILGLGNSSNAAFSPGTSVQTTVEAQTCVDTTPPAVCNAQTVSLPHYSLLNPFNGVTANFAGTQETSNLQTYYLGQPPAPVCSGFTCRLTFTSSTAPPN